MPTGQLAQWSHYLGIPLDVLCTLLGFIPGWLCCSLLSRQATRDRARREAIESVDDVPRKSKSPANPSTTASDSTEEARIIIDEALLLRALQSLRSGNKIAAIKLLRQQTGLSLTAAKSRVTEMEREYLSGEKQEP